MKTYNLLYIISLIVLAVTIFLLVLFPSSGRIHLIAGGLTAIGFVLNIAGFSMKKR